MEWNSSKPMLMPRLSDETDDFPNECFVPLVDQGSDSEALARSHLQTTPRTIRMRCSRAVSLAVMSFMTLMLGVVRSDTISTGSKVVQATPSLILRPSRSMQTSKGHHTHRINVYKIKNIDGPWLLVADDSELESGWVARDEVVPVGEACTYFTNLINKENNNLFFKIMRARVLRERGELGNALNDVEAALRLAPAEGSLYVHRSAIWKAAENYEKAIEDLDLAIQLDPGDSEKYYHRACVWESIREYDEAISDFTAAIRFNPSDYVAHYSRGLVRYRKKEFDKALLDFSESIRLNPHFARGYNDRGVCRNDKREFDMAISDFNEALRLKPQFPFAYNNRGNSWLWRGNNDKAIMDYGEAIRLDPSYSVAYNNRSAAWYNKRKYSEAIADATKAIQINPRCTSAFLRRGMSRLARKEFREAIGDFEHAIQLDKTNTWALSLYARVLATCLSDECRNGRRALELSQEACELSGWKNSYMLSTLAASYAEIGEFDLAVIWQAQALKLLSNADIADIDYYRSGLNRFKAGKALRE